MFCKKCGSEVDEGASFCLKCGTKLDYVSGGPVKSGPFINNNVNTQNDKAQEINPVSSMPSDRQGNKKGIIVCVSVILAAIVLLLVLLLVVVPALKKNDSGNSVTEDTNETEDKVETAEPVVLDLLNVKVVEGSGSSPVSDATVTIKGNGYEVTENCDNGLAFFSGITGGDCTIICEAEDYNSMEFHASLDADDKEITLPAIPVLFGDDTYVVLSWEGESNLDLCAFNSDLGEYINPGHREDRDGNVSLHNDLGSVVNYEILYIEDSRVESPVTVYVAAETNASENTSSDMEANGFDLSVFNRNGLAFSFNPDKNETAPLISVCNIASGSVSDNTVYINDISSDEYKWLSYSEEDAVSRSSDKWKEAYLDVLINDPDGVMSEDAIDPKSICYGLLYINDDEIPELVVSRRYLSQTYHEGITIYTCNDDKAVKVDVDYYKYFTGAEAYYYFEKQDYLKIDQANETPFNSWTLGYIPVFDQGSPTYKDSGIADEGFDCFGEDWYRDGEKTTKSDYTGFESTLGEARKIEDECIGYSEMIALLSDGENSSADSSADSPVDSWKVSYKTFINSKTWEKEVRFLLVCIDDDDQPELVVYNLSTTDVYIYNGKGTELKASFENMGAHGINNEFYERTGYVVRSGAGDSDPEFGMCPFFVNIEPVFDKKANSYSTFEYAVGYNESTFEYELATDYSKNGNTISESAYKSETSSITSHPLRTYDDAFSKSEILKKLS